MTDDAELARWSREAIERWGTPEQVAALPPLSVTGALTGPLGVGDDAIAPLLDAAQAEINRVFTVPERFLKTYMPSGPTAAHINFARKVIALIDFGAMTAQEARERLMRLWRPRKSRGWRRHVRRQKAAQR